jgi:hypothetical protein
VKAHAVIKALDESEDGGGGGGAGQEDATVDEFVFEGAPERFHGGIVVAVAAAAHGGDEAALVEEAAIFGTGVLPALIGVMDEACGRPTVREGHLQRR